MSADVAVAFAETETGAAYVAGIAAAPARDLGGHPYVINPLTGAVISLEHLQRRPNRLARHMTLERLEDFIAYVNRFKSQESSIYGNGKMIKAELDHRGKEDLVWPDHTVCMNLGPTDEFSRWTACDQLDFNQADFAEWLEENAAYIAVPESAEMIEIARTLAITRNSAVVSVARTSGTNMINFNHEQKVRGPNDVEIPTWFEISITPYANFPHVIDIRARLRVRITQRRDSGQDYVIFSYALQNLRKACDEVLDFMLFEIKEKTELPVYR